MAHMFINRWLPLLQRNGRHPVRSLKEVALAAASTMCSAVFSVPETGGEPLIRAADGKTW